jgi:hypothetical protein
MSFQIVHYEFVMIYLEQDLPRLELVQSVHLHFVFEQGFLMRLQGYSHHT